MSWPKRLLWWWRRTVVARQCRAVARPHSRWRTHRQHHQQTSPYLIEMLSSKNNNGLERCSRSLTSTMRQRHSSRRPHQASLQHRLFLPSLRKTHWSSSNGPSPGMMPQMVKTRVSHRYLSWMLMSILLLSRIRTTRITANVEDVDEQGYFTRMELDDCKPGYLSHRHS